MQPKKRMKMCPFCEGQVEIQMAICPFCGADIGHQEESAEGRDVRSLSPQETLASLYPPPYKAKGDDTLLQQTKETPNFYAHEAAAMMKEESAEKKASVNLLGPFLMVSVGMNLLFLSLFLFFFSTDGEIELHWKGYWWVIYFMIGLPLLIFGYKKFSENEIS